VEHYISYTADSSWNHVITRNHFYDNDDYAVFITVTASTADIDHDVVLRGNVFEGNEATSNESVVEVNIGYDLDGDYDLSFNMGTASAYGYNTIVADEANPLSGSISCDVYMSSITAGDVNMVGNWWGTQDLLEIGDRVWDQADSSSLFAADLSSPLPDSLDFTIAYDEGLGQITITAGPDAGFVAYAGDLNLMAEIVGFGTAEVPADAVSEDYQTITFAGGIPLPDGTYDICLTNPGGQTGCASFTVGGDEDCSQNQIPTAVSDSEGTDQATAVTIDLTANDVDFDGNLDPNSVVITQQPHRGTLVNNGDGTATYLPDADQVDTTDTFNYTVSDTCGATSNVASCEVVIGGSVNTIPSAIYDAVQTEMDAAITIDVLANDSDPDGDDLDVGSVVITGGANKGTATVNPDGTVTYTPNAGVAGTTDTFNYTVDDEHGATSNIATVEVFIQYIIDTEDVTGGIGGGADRSGTPGARGGLGNGANPNQGATRSP
jgi:hypothetical protein